MITKSIKTVARFIRHRRVRVKITGTKNRPRLSVYRSNKFIYASLINDDNGQTLVSASSAGKIKSQKERIKTPSQFSGVDKAYEVGMTLAKLAIAKKISQVVFDRSGYRYQGQIKSLAAGARAGGLEF